MSGSRAGAPASTAKVFLRSNPQSLRWIAGLCSGFGGWFTVGRSTFFGQEKKQSERTAVLPFFRSVCLLVVGVPYIPKKALYRASPNVVRKNPQKLCRGRSCRQRPVSKTAQKGCVFTPGSAGEPVNASDDLKQV